MIRRLLSEQKDLEKTAVIESGREISYAGLLRLSSKIQSLLPQGQQERVAVLLPGGGDFIAALWAVLQSGMTAFPLNTLMTGHEILPLLKQASVKTVITVSEYRPRLVEAPGFEVLLPDIILVDRIGATANGHEPCAAAKVDADTCMLLLNTSGTTGKAKIVQLSERNVETAVRGYLDKLEPAKEKDIRFILATPFFSAYGIMVISLCLMQSLTVIVPDSPFTLDALYMAAEKHRATHYAGSGTVVILMDQTAGREIPYDIRTLKTFAFGGSKISGGTVERVLAAYPGIGLYQGYGMTEASPIITRHSRTGCIKPDSVGTVIKGLELVVETESGIESTPFVTGEIVVRGPSVMLGYLDNELETGRILKNGYLYTGDIGYLDDEGYLYICGRKKNIIIVRGFNVYPEEVEDCIQNSRLAKDCVVYGQTDAYGSETVCADIVPDNPQVREAEIRAYCRTRLAEYKVPKKISFCASIRKNASGKTERC